MKINKILSTALFASLLIATAGEAREFNMSSTKSLLGFEGGYSNTYIDTTTATTSTTTKFKPYHGGIKIGGESEDYRLFLSARYYNVDGFDYITTYGGELQYKFNFSNYMNFFVGFNAGLANAKYKPATTTVRTFSKTYYGADAGFNIHMGESVDLEFGSRVMSIAADNLSGTTTYTFDRIVTGYGSLIFKYSMD